MKTVLITGISGFAGSFLAEYVLSEKDIVIHGTYISDSSLSNIAHIQDKVHVTKIDLSDYEAVYNLIQLVKPTIVFHLAALTSPGESFRNPSATLTQNITLQANLLEAIRKSNLLETKILITSSADVYGLVSEDEQPMSEETPLRPVSPYAVSKIAQDFLGLQYRLSYGMHIIRVRPFNHIGPRQADLFVVASFAKQIAEIEKGKKEPVIYTGNIKAKRDFTDVRDMVKAYRLLIEKGIPGEVYNIGSGKSYTISEILNRLLSYSSKKITIKQDEKLLRPNDTIEYRADATKMQRITDWKPSISLDNSLKDILAYWRATYI